MTTYTLRCDGAEETIEAGTLSEARTQAREGDYGDQTETTWVDVSITGEDGSEDRA